MGYCIEQGETRFRLNTARREEAFGALKALAESGRQSNRGRFAWVETVTLLRARSVEDHLKEWGWLPALGVDGTVVGLELQHEKLGEDKKLFDALAPFVEPGSYIVIRGEEGDTWRWYFDGSRCIEQAAQTSFGPVPGDVIDVQAREVRPGDRALPGPYARALLALGIPEPPASFAAPCDARGCFLGVAAPKSKLAVL